MIRFCPYVRENVHLLRIALFVHLGMMISETVIYNITRMTTSIKAKLQLIIGQTIINKCRVTSL